MGKRGARSEPTSLKLSRGNPGHRPLNKDEPEFTPGAPTKPEWITGRASDEWDRVVPVLLGLGLLSPIHQTILGAYCLATADMIACEADLAARGTTVDGKFGEVANPSAAMRDKAVMRMRQIAVEFGMTPSASSGLAVKSKKAGDDFDEFVASGKVVSG